MKANRKMIRLSYIATLLVLLCSAAGAQTLDRMVTDIEVPLQDPYCDGSYDAITIDAGNPLSCPSVTVEAVPEDVVDWVLMELRSTDAGDAATAATDVVARKPAFLLSNGRVVDAARYAEQMMQASTFLCTAASLETTEATCPDVEFVELEEADDEDIYLVVRHRNHLDVISATNITGVADTNRNADIYSHDFSAGGSALNDASALKEKDSNIHVLYGGDVNRDGEVNITDYTIGTAGSIGISAYHAGDTNFSSIVTPADYSDIIANNLTQSSQVP